MKNIKKNIAVIFGSRSTEHDISIITAEQVISALNREKYNIIPIYITHSGEWFTGEQLFSIDFFVKINDVKKSKKLKRVAILPCSDFLYYEKFGKYKKNVKIDCAIISCHGKNGEDGTLQGLLELSNIPYSSSGVVGSSVGLDKILMKRVFDSYKIPICDFVEISKFEYEKFGTKIIFEKLNFPLIVKPNALGSSIGITICKNQRELDEAIKLAFLFDEKIIVEKVIENLKEVNISVFGDGKNCFCSKTEEVQNKSGLLTFEKKYMVNPQKTNEKLPNNSKIKQNNVKNTASSKNGMQNLDRIIPANITKKQLVLIEKLSKTIFEKLNCKGIVRIDFMIDKDNGKVFANEINTIPGSFAFYLWEKTGITFDKLLDNVIEKAISNNFEQNSLTTTFLSGVLSGIKISK